MVHWFWKMCLFLVHLVSFEKGEKNPLTSSFKPEKTKKVKDCI